MRNEAELSAKVKVARPFDPEYIAIAEERIAAEKGEGRTGTRGGDARDP